MTLYGRNTAEHVIKIFGAVSNWLFWLLAQIGASHVINEGLGSRKNQSQSLVTVGQGCRSLECVCVCAGECVRMTFIAAGHWGSLLTFDPGPDHPDPAPTSLSGSGCRAEGLVGSSC